MNLKAPAKLNLNLHLLPQERNNGYYQVRFINCELSLADELFFKKIKNKINLICNKSKIIKKEDNLVYKAAFLLKKLIKDNDLGAEINLKKNIPIKSGLGGGSSDAAATLKGLIKLWGVSISEKQLLEIASQLGKDVFYSLKGGVCEVSGDGTIVNKLKTKIPQISLIIVTPKIQKPSTAWMYKNLKYNDIGRHIYKLNNIKKSIIKKDKKGIIHNLFNDFESLAVKEFPVISIIKKDLVKEGALNTLLAGSGLSVVGFFNSKLDAVTALNKLKMKYKAIFYAETK